MSKVPLGLRMAVYTSFDPATGCVNWTGGKSLKGYGRIRVGAKHQAAHRVAWELERGPIPPGLVIDHLCRNPACCRPEHMEPVTTGENTRRGNSGLKDARKTHCPQGHPYDAANTYRPPSGGRMCRRCLSERQRRRRAERPKPFPNRSGDA